MRPFLSIGIGERYPIQFIRLGDILLKPLTFFDWNHLTDRTKPFDQPLAVVRWGYIITGCSSILRIGGGLVTHGRFVH